ncbi:MAG: flavin reductase family protein [Eubacteriales bacterium]|nr:flavin reductase family protein [Eubacteriales bacterium]
MGRQNWRGGALVAPIPTALVSCGREGKVNVLTVAWCGILSTVPPRTYISVRPERYSYNIIKETGEFVINLPRADMARTVDFCGMYTGSKVDKVARCNLHLGKSKEVLTPHIEECPIALECRVREIINSGSHDVFFADIVSVSVDDSIINADGKMEIARANLMAYAHGEYFSLGKKLGVFGFSSMKANSQKKKTAAILRNRKKNKND